MTTPEGKVKILVRALLKEYNVYYFQPVQTGYGSTGLDFHCVVSWRNIAVAFFIETKAPGKVPTERQNILIDKLRSLHAKVFVIEDERGVRRLEQWLQALQDQSAVVARASRQFSMIMSSQRKTL